LVATLFAFFLAIDVYFAHFDDIDPFFSLWLIDKLSWSKQYVLELGSN
jgi:hypothetical protein